MRVKSNHVLKSDSTDHFKMVSLLTLVSFLILFLLSTSVHGLRDQCGWKNCHQRNESKPLAVHIIPHSHVSDHFTETRDSVFDKYTRKIYSNVLQSLTANRNRTFVVSDIGSFAKWFELLTWDEKIYLFRAVSDEQITFVSGSWTTSDESVTHYVSLIDSLTLGNRWLKNHFRDCAISTVGWQLNSFGHSRTFAEVLVQAGYKALFFSRMDRRKEIMKTDHSLIFNWNVFNRTEGTGNRSNSEPDSILTILTSEMYSPPAAFSFESNWYPISQEELQGGATEMFVNYVKELSTMYQTSEVFVLMGGDFSFLNSEIHFKSIDALIESIQKEPSYGADIFYSTPNCYVKSIGATRTTSSSAIGTINASLGTKMSKWPTIQGDFLPVTDPDDVNQAFSGYFTTNPNLKYQIRQLESLTVATSQLRLLMSMVKFGNDGQSINRLKEEVASMQTISGIGGVASSSLSSHLLALTERRAKNALRIVSNDFMDVLDTISSLNGGLINGDVIKGSLITKISVCQSPFLQTCLLDTNLLDNLFVYVYNPSIHEEANFVRLSIPERLNYLVTNWQGYDIASQLVTSPFDVTKSDRSNKTDPVNRLYFKTILPPLGITSFRITKVTSNSLSVGSTDTETEDNFIANSRMKVTFNRVTGSLESVLIAKTGQLINLEQKLISYKPSPKSNHLVFDPEDGAVDLSTTLKLISVTRGLIVQEINQVVNNFINQTIRLFQDKNYIEFEYFIDTLPEDTVGMELLVRLESDLTSSYFFTDSNCRGSVERKTRSHARAQVSTGNGIGSSFYPATCYVSIKDGSKNIQMNVFTVRPMAVSSLSPGTLELLIQRKIPFKSGSIDEDVNYTEPILVHNWLSFESEEKEVYRRSKSFHWKPIVFFNHETTKPETVQYSFVNMSLNRNLHLLTLERISFDSGISQNSGNSSEEHLLIRLESISTNETVSQDIEYLFKNIRVVKLFRTNLAASFQHDQIEKRRMRSGNQQKSLGANAIGTKEMESTFYPLKVTVKPNQIETYLVSFVKN